MKDNLKIAVYGSLREGQYNYNAFKNYYPEGFTKVGEGVVEDYALFSLGSYPGINPHQGSKLVVDIMECSQDCYDSIRLMELGAGYRLEEVTVEGHDCGIYVYNYPTKSENFIESGDWALYLAAKS